MMTLVAHARLYLIQTLPQEEVVRKWFLLRDVLKMKLVLAP
jgi:hypothetical protein